MPKVSYSIIGLSEFEVTFEDYCRTCPSKLQRYCTHGKSKPLTIKIDCKDIRAALEKQKYAKMQKLQKDTAAGEALDLDSISISKNQVISQLYQDNIKSDAENIRCISKHVDSFEAADRAREFWDEFRRNISDIMVECEKIGS